MVLILVLFTFVATAIAALEMLIMCIVFFIRRKEVKNEEESSDLYLNSYAQIKTCRIAGVAFIILSWILSTGMPRGLCLDNYREISIACFFIGCIWGGMAFLITLFIFFFGLMKHETAYMDKLKLFSRCSFRQSVIFFVFSLLLDVSM